MLYRACLVALFSCLALTACPAIKNNPTPPPPPDLRDDIYNVAVNCGSRPAPPESAPQECGIPLLKKLYFSLA